MADRLFYVGTYSVRGSKGIYAFRLDTASGALAPAGIAAGGPVNNPSFLAVHPNGRFLYAACETGAGAVAAFTLDPATGVPVLLNQQPSQGSGPCYVSLDHRGRNVLIANYGSGSVAVLPIGPEGGLLPASASVQHHGGSGVVPSRQEGPHAHWIQTAPDDRFAVAADLGLDRLLVYRFDSVKGTLAANEPPFAAAQPGAGPRHAAFHPGGKLAFFVNELNSTLVSCRWNGAKGILIESEVASTLPDGFNGKNFPAEVAVHPSGRSVYASNRGHDSIAAFAVDTTTGRLRSLGHFSTLGKNPRNFAVDPSGAFLIVANQDTDSLVAFRIDARTGRLTPTGVTADVPSPVCVCFAATAA